MKFNFGPYSALLLLFFIHGIVYAYLALKEGVSYNTKSSLWHSGILFLLCLYFSPFMCGYAGWYATDGYREVLYYLPLQQLLIIGPVLYFYIQSLLYPGFVFKRHHWLHFLPGILYLLYSLLIFLGDIFYFEEIYFYQDGQDKDFDLWYQVAGFISLASYFLLSLYHYQQYRKQIFDTLSYAEEIAYSWVRRFLILFLIIPLPRILFFVLNPEWGQFGRKFWYYFSISLVTYYLAIRGYNHTLLLRSAHAQRPSDLQTAVYHLSPILQNISNEPEPSQSAEPDEHPEAMEKIQQLMHEKQLYENPVLNLGDIATELNVTPKVISQTINKHTGMNFNNYINQFRVQAVIHKFSSNMHEEITLLGIAYSCGFNSKSTFNRAFKKYTGLTPREYLAKNH